MCCDAFNINHIQRTGRTRSSVHQLESAHASGVGSVLHRPLKSAPLIAGAVSVSGPPGRAIYFPLAHGLKLGLETFSTTFSADSARVDSGGSTQPRHACGFPLDTTRKQCLDADFKHLLGEILPSQLDRLGKKRFLLWIWVTSGERILRGQEIGVSAATQAAKMGHLRQPSVYIYVKKIK